MVERNWVWALNAIDKCLETAYKAKNERIKEFWYNTADSLEQKYFPGQPWLRTYDGKLN